ncbi:39S ribosomal protein L48, mitochondrial [Octopus bimaculoides]|uniref:Small ribosomal subunit protein uS10 domain-containing protein n=1 Tax=Octopus bimaculoides TaxID=37653 RepID=A0A0L8GB23_OCTBM|nr:39S ribosomal protein L48, mitochondrial [Octopus bimaculoides]|eukprot:XP_014782926.1 PREDICTED: 39S ribosomal protein L48, mitochondrial-like [Octopus bimaculoides]
MLLPVATNLLRRFGSHRDIIRGLLRQQKSVIASSVSCSSSLTSAATENESPSSISGTRNTATLTPRRDPIRWEPTDVGLPPEVEPYQSLCIEMKGYDFAVLEKFACYVHKMCDNLGHNCEAFAMPAKSLHVSTYRPRSSVIDNTYELQVYERNVLLQDLANTALPHLISLFTGHLPEGVTLRIRHYTASDESNRYIPDRQLRELHGQLDEIAASRKKK